MRLPGGDLRTTCDWNGVFFIGEQGSSGGLVGGMSRPVYLKSIIVIL